MKLPVVAYGNDILTRDGEEIDYDYEGLDTLIDDMWETLYGARGVGLAAPQIDRSIRLFIVDSEQTYQGMNRHDRELFFDGDTGIRETFINPRVESLDDKTWHDTEGCLSIPGIVEDIERPWSIKITYQGLDFQEYTRIFRGLTARMVQHEYDHTRGVLFLDYLGSFRMTMLKKKLDDIAGGRVETPYPMQFV